MRRLAVFALAAVFLAGAAFLAAPALEAGFSVFLADVFLVAALVVSFYIEPVRKNRTKESVPDS